MGERAPEDRRSPPENQQEHWRRTIYCGGLRYETDEQTVKNYFVDEYGPVATIKASAWCCAP